MAAKEPTAKPQPLHLHPGFRFHPTDEELITNYLVRKILDTNFVAEAAGEVDLNKCEPWDLPSKAVMGGSQWYFFCMKDRKYPTGSRTNRATEAGYWKATGKDKEVCKVSEMINNDGLPIKLAELVGMKKTLVFYKGRAPKGVKTNWVMHEYRLEGSCSCLRLPADAPKDDWVICRVFRKSPSGRRVPIPDSFVVAESTSRTKNDPFAPCSTFDENQLREVMDSPVANVDFSEISLNDPLMSSLNAPHPTLTATSPLASVSRRITSENNINVPTVPENSYRMNHPNFLINDTYLLDPVNQDPSSQLRAILQEQLTNNCGLQPELQHQNVLPATNIIPVPQNSGFNSNLAERNSQPFQIMPLEIPIQEIPSSLAEPELDQDYFCYYGI